MKIKYNISEIMRRAHQMVREACARGVNSPLCDFAYCLKNCWRGARAERLFWLDGGTCKGGTIFCIVMED